MISVLSVLVSIWATLVFLVGYISLSRYVRRGSKFPPGNMGWPLIGETLSFIKPHPTTARGEFMERRLSRFGKIFSSHLLGNRTVVSVDTELNRFIMKHDVAMFGPGWPRALMKLVGESAIVLLVGDAHKIRRSIYLDFLSSERLRTTFLPDAERMASWLLGSWIDGSVISAKDEANKFSFYIMVKEIASMAHGDPKVEDIRRENEAYAKGFASLPLYLPGTAYWKASKSRANIIQFFKQKTEDKIRKKSDGNARAKEDDDFLSWAMKNTNYSPEEIGDLMLGTLFVGHDTTSRAISLLIYFLGGCPKAIEQLREEHREIIRSKQQRGEGKLTWEDYRAMEFTHCVINETLRLGNVSAHINKKATTDFEFKGYVIPRGCNVIIHTSAVHLDPTVFEGPQIFNPWRWLCPSGVKKIDGFMPFGGGARLCPGKDLARLEMIVFLHHLILKFDWELIEPDHPIIVLLVDFPKGLGIKVRALSTESHTM